MNTNIAYLTNQYPAVSHTFIRNEILALERQGFKIKRISIRKWAGRLVDPQDMAEEVITEYLLKSKISALLSAGVMFLRRPIKFLACLKQAFGMSKTSGRSYLVHLGYLVEACKLLQVLSPSNIQHVHAHFGTNAADVCLLAKLLGGISYSVTIHGSGEFDKPEALSLNLKISNASFAVAVSSFGRAQLFRWADINDWNKIHIVRCGLDRREYSDLNLSTNFSRKLVCVGRLCGEKAQHMLLEAMKKIKLSGIVFQLTLVGDGETRAELEKLIDLYDIKDSVEITGWAASSEVTRQVLSGRALILPSFAENLPLVIMEAMAMHRPVIATYVGGIPELVLPGETGWLVPASSSDELALAIVQCLCATQEELVKMGQNAGERVWKSHDVDKEAIKLAQHFCSIR